MTSRPPLRGFDYAKAYPLRGEAPPPAAVVGGSFQSQVFQNIGANIFVIAFEIKIGIAQNGKSEGDKIGVTLSIVCLGLFFIMLRPI